MPRVFVPLDLEGHKLTDETLRAIIRLQKRYMVYTQAADALAALEPMPPAIPPRVS